MIAVYKYNKYDIADLIAKDLSDRGFEVHLSDIEKCVDCDVILPLNEQLEITVKTDEE